LVLRLVRFLDENTNKESLIVEAEGREVTRFPWTADLVRWMDAHTKEIDEEGDDNATVFISPWICEPVF
jgi:hypothetical protein